MLAIPVQDAIGFAVKNRRFLGVIVWPPKDLIRLADNVAGYRDNAQAELSEIPCARVGSPLKRDYSCYVRIGPETSALCSGYLQPPSARYPTGISRIGVTSSGIRVL